MQHKSHIAIALTLGTAVGAFGSFALVRPVAAQGPTDTPPAARARQDSHLAFMYRALQNTQHIRHDLQGERHDFGGHRVAAINALTTAENELNAAIEFGKTDGDKK